MIISRHTGIGDYFERPGDYGDWDEICDTLMSFIEKEIL